MTTMQIELERPLRTKAMRGLVAFASVLFFWLVVATAAWLAWVTTPHPATDAQTTDAAAQP